jgi:branched-chain amino acid transport system permease protein
VLGQIVSDVLSLAPVYGVLAVGFVIVYRFTGVLNFAHGALTALGAYAIYFASTRLLLPPAAAFAFTAVAGAVAGVIVFALVIRPMKGRPVFATVLVTIGLSIIVDSVINLFWGSSPKSLDDDYGFAGHVHGLFANVSISTDSVMMWVLYGVMLGAILVGLRRTRFGIQGRAAAEDPLLAAYRGINIQVVFLAAWAVAISTAFVAGGVYATNHSVLPGIALLALKGFPVAMVGGLDSVAGTLVGALVVATGESVAVQLIGPRLANIVPYAAMLIVLLVKPWGLWGTREELDRV